MYTECCYSSVDAQVERQGHRSTDDTALRDYLQNDVSHRLSDTESHFVSSISALSTTGMAPETIERALASQPDYQPEDVGEALAECFIRDRYNVIWPWNMVWDKRTPKASLQGADLVGILNNTGDAHLVFGEVKTSSDDDSPPSAMYSMLDQLRGLAADIAIQWTLLQWLLVRCKGSELQRSFEQAAAKFLNSGGRALVLFGVLIRDTEPKETDLSARATSFAASIEAPTRVILNALYLPLGLIAQLPTLVVRGRR